PGLFSSAFPRLASARYHSAPLRATDVESYKAIRKLDGLTMSANARQLLRLPPGTSGVTCAGEIASTPRARNRIAASPAGSIIPAVAAHFCATAASAACV